MQLASAREALPCFGLFVQRWDRQLLQPSELHSSLLGRRVSCARADVCAEAVIRTLAGLHEIFSSSSPHCEDVLRMFVSLAKAHMLPLGILK